MRNPYNPKSKAAPYLIFITLAALFINLFFAYAAASLTAPYGGVRSNVSLAIFIAIATVSLIGLLAALLAYKTSSRLTAKSYPDLSVGTGLVANAIALLSSLAILLFAFTPITSYFADPKDVDLSPAFESRLAGLWEFSTDSSFVHAQFDPNRRVHLRAVAKDLPQFDYAGIWSLLILKGQADPTLRILVDHLYTGTSPPVGSTVDLKFISATDHGLTLSNDQDTYLLLPQGGQQPQPTTTP